MTARTPTALRVLQGQADADAPRTEPVPSSREVVAPEWLDADALAVWDRLAPDLIKTNVLTFWDVDTFAVYVNAVARHAEYSVQLREEGPTVDQGTGSVKQNPLVPLIKGLADTVRTTGGKFGLNPSDRAGLDVNTAGRGKDPLQDF